MEYKRFRFKKLNSKHGEVYLDRCKNLEYVINLDMKVSDRNELAKEKFTTHRIC